MATKQKNVALIFECVGGWFVCSDDSEMLDARGARYESKNQAIAGMKNLNSQEKRYGDASRAYTHYRVSGSKITRKI